MEFLLQSANFIWTGFLVLIFCILVIDSVIQRSLLVFVIDNLLHLDYLVQALRNMYVRVCIWEVLLNLVESWLLSMRIEMEVLRWIVVALKLERWASYFLHVSETWASFISNVIRLHELIDRWYSWSWVHITRYFHGRVAALIRYLYSLPTGHHSLVHVFNFGRNAHFFFTLLVFRLLNLIVWVIIRDFVGTRLQLISFEWNFFTQLVQI